MKSKFHSCKSRPTQFIFWLCPWIECTFRGVLKKNVLDFDPHFQEAVKLLRSAQLSRLGYTYIYYTVENLFRNTIFLESLNLYCPLQVTTKKRTYVGTYKEIGAMDRFFRKTLPYHCTRLMDMNNKNSLSCTNIC